MDSNISQINNMLAEYAERVPAKGMHLGYLQKAKELVELHSEALSVIEDEEAPERLEEITRKVQDIVK